MDRRRAIAIATATVATTVGATAALAANLGLLGFGGVGASPMGKLDAGQVSRSVELPADPTGSDPEVTVRYEEVYLPVPAAQPAGAVMPGGSPPGGALAPAEPVTTSPTGYGAQDGSDDGCNLEQDRDGDRGHDEGYEDEGREDEAHDEDDD